MSDSSQVTRMRRGDMREQRMEDRLAADVAQLREEEKQHMGSPMSEDKIEAFKQFLDRNELAEKKLQQAREATQKARTQAEERRRIEARRRYADGKKVEAARVEAFKAQLRADIKRMDKGQISKETLRDLARSGLNETDAAIMSLVDVTDHWCQKEVGRFEFGYLIPFHDLNGKLYKPPFVRVRFHTRHREDWLPSEDTNPKEQRYSQCAGSGVRGYFSRRIDWLAILADACIGICITEGEKKAEAMCKAGIPTVGVTGCYNFRRDGELLDELKRLARGRRITIVYDSDKAKKDKHGRQPVVRAEVELATELRAQGARVYIASLKSNGEKKAGADDVLVADGKKSLKAVLIAAQEFTPRDVVQGIREHQKSNDARHRNVAEAIVEEMKVGGRFIHTDYGSDSVGLMYFDNLSKTLLSLDSPKSRELRSFIDERFGVTGACLEFGLTYERLADTAMAHGERVKVFKLTHYDASTGTWYRAASQSTMFRATAKGWSIVDNGTDGVLIHTRGSMDEIEVSKIRVGKAAFNLVIDLPNFVDGNFLTAAQARMLWATYVVGLNFPDLLPTREIPLFNGPKGSGKTSGARAVMRTEYGQRGQVTSIDATKFDSLQSIVVNNQIACLDNIDGKHDGLQNLLASVATGGMVELRQLYTTMEEAKFHIDCFLMATSRDPKSFVRDDITERLLYFQVARRGSFQAESELMALIDANRPKYWRWMLDMMPKVISALQATKSGRLHDDRMADSAKFVLAVAPVLGFAKAEVRAALDAMNSEKLNFQSEYSPVLGAITAYVEYQAKGLAEIRSEGAYTNAVRDLTKPMTAAELLAAIKLAKPDFPYTNARSFGQALRNDMAAIEVKFTCKLGEIKKDKVKTYAIAPLGGYAPWVDPTKRQKVADSGGG